MILGQKDRRLGLKLMIMGKKVDKIDNPLEDLEDNEITNVDPTKIGGLDKNVAEDFDEGALEWTKSRGKKKDQK